jgi:hypothetical protein
MKARIELEVVVSYDYEPAEPMVWRDGSGDGHPGSPDSATVTEVLLGDLDILHLLTPEQMERIEEQCCEDARDRSQAELELRGEDRMNARIEAAL